MGNDWFHFADVIGGNSCLIYLEQDECVLGILDDCTDRAVSRQWYGRLSPGLDVTLVARRGSAEPGPQCSGRIGETPEERSRLELRCVTSPDHAGSKIVLERRLDSPPALGEVERRVDVFPYLGAGPFADMDEYMFDAAEVKVAGRDELWFTVGAGDHPQTGVHMLDQHSRSLVGFVPMPYAQLVEPAGASVVAVSSYAITQIEAETRNVLGTTPLSGGLAPTALSFIAGEGRVFVGFDPGDEKFSGLVLSFDLGGAGVLARSNELLVGTTSAIVSVPRQPDGTVAFVFGFSSGSGAALMLGVDVDLGKTRTHTFPFRPNMARYLPERSVVAVVGGNRYAELDPTDQQTPLRTVVGVPYTEAGQDFSFDAARNRVYFLGRSYDPSQPTTFSHMRPSLLTTIDLTTERAEQRIVTINAMSRRVFFLEAANAVVVPLQRLGRVEWIKL